MFPPDSNICLRTHFNFSDLFQVFAAHRPDYAKIIMIRDLRDVCVSTTYFIKDYLDVVLGPQAPFDKRLLYVIKGTAPIMNISEYNVQREASAALQWMSDPSVVVCRFEDLVGENGGGSKEAQRMQIRLVVDALGISLTEMEIDEMAESLWGGTKTFREGQIGGWKKHFKPIHIQAFKKQLGALLIQLGYEKDYQW